MSQTEITRRELLKVLLGIPLVGVFVGALSPILRLLKPFGKLGFAIPPPSQAKLVLGKIREPYLTPSGGTGFTDVEANYNSLKPMTGYSFEIVTVDASIPTKPVKISNPGILIKDNEGNLHAYNAKCTHLACVVYWDSSTSNWHCRCHDGFFDPVTTAVLSGSPPKPLNPWNVTVDEGTGAITVEKV